jgi:hypothetical protein
MNNVLVPSLWPAKDTVVPTVDLVRSIFDEPAGATASVSEEAGGAR